MHIVRCGIAAKADALLGANVTEEVSSVLIEGSNEHKEFLEEKTRSNECNNSIDEDGWVGIKVPDSALLHSKTLKPLQSLDAYMD
ncbi:hypothetical protein FRX31_019385 [Thalictrum thalictroides]|uniref:Uncharacterized protein n=1 Tax=Thalictrum thalictroides TaxID=46969 RepID=A0A7J6W2L0_THATH|nr:hypothetical protein FRX31_019385 [Thalictrum thalictroides]